ncbi:MAG: glycerophosphodiester phosphodiesterase family protein, partial [Leucobacter sp.]
MSHPYFSGPRPRILAHRGYVPEALSREGILENTRSAFANAVAAGATHLESDCHLTSDGTVVFFHDSDLRRTLGDPRRVSEISAVELTYLMADRGGLLTLESALAEFPAARWNLDLKAPGVAVPAGRVIGGSASDRVLITSFTEAHRLRGIDAAVHASPVGSRPAAGASQRSMAQILAALTTRSRSMIARSFAGIDALQVPEKQGPIRVLSRRLVKAAHEHGTEVHVWTVNDPDR